MQIPRSITKLVSHCETENSRYALSCVKLERTGNRARAIATDGRRMIVAQWQDNQEGELETLIPAEAIKRVAKQLPKLGKKAKPAEKTLSLAEGAELNEKAKITTAPGLEVVTETNDGRYPRYASVYSLSGAETATIRVSAKMLREALQALEAITADNEIDSNRIPTTSVDLTIQIGRSGDGRLNSRIRPLIVSLASGYSDPVQAAAVIMPLELKHDYQAEKTETPAWTPEQ